MLPYLFLKKNAHDQFQAFSFIFSIQRKTQNTISILFLNIIPCYLTSFLKKKKKIHGNLYINFKQYKSIHNSVAKKLKNYFLHHYIQKESYNGGCKVIILGFQHNKDTDLSPKKFQTINLQRMGQKPGLLRIR